MPTTSPFAISFRSIGSSVSSTRWGSPHVVPVAAARTYNQRGVMTATPNDRFLGLIKCTREDNRSPLRENAVSYCVSASSGEKPVSGGQGEQTHGTPFTTDHQQAPAGAGPHRET